MRPRNTQIRHPLSRPAWEKSRNRGHGFTLLELTVVLLLIGILSSLAIYGYRMMIDKARMTQAKTVLTHLVKTQAIYYSDHDRYTDNVSQLDFDPVKYPYYTVSVVLDNNAKVFLGIAAGTGPMTGDWWTITKDGVPVQADNSAFR